jgi:hypothetical protein
MKMSAAIKGCPGNGMVIRYGLIVIGLFFIFYIISYLYLRSSGVLVRINGVDRDGRGIVTKNYPELFSKNNWIYQISDLYRPCFAFELFFRGIGY